MKKYRKVHLRKSKRHSAHNIKVRALRSGSKQAKAELLELNPHCDICGVEGNNKTLQIHHIYLIRHGFHTRVDRCTLLCSTCHHNFHKRWDNYLDVTFRENPQTDFVKIYNVIKRI